MEAVYSESLAEIAAGRRPPQPTREFVEITLQEAAMAKRALGALQVALGIKRFKHDWKFPKGSRDDRPLIVRRVWFYALSLIEDDGRPIFTGRKLARLSGRSEKVVRLDCAMAQAWAMSDGVIAGFVEQVVEYVSSTYALAASAAAFFEATEAAIADNRRAARQVRRAAVRAAQCPPSPLPADTRTPFQMEIDALHQRVIDQRKANELAQAERIRAAVRANQKQPKQTRAA